MELVPLLFVDQQATLRPKVQWDVEQHRSKQCQPQKDVFTAQSLAWIGGTDPTPELIGNTSDENRIRMRKSRDNAQE
jgi:hypothetical protein